LSSAPTVAIALGSNLGDRASHLRYAAAALGRVLTGLRMSRFHETEPVGVSVEQPMYLNAVAVGECAIGPAALLDALLAVEAGRGRARPVANAPRTLDLDQILYGDAVINEPSLVVPHPRFRERRFVLEPLTEIAPDVRDPVTGRTMAELLALLPRAPRGPRR
jgi:2-amino-4-hydroxy-6-hydroxymethyldihydropteridine diphosphokinase